MVNYFIYAKDFSGSTDGVDFYHENGLKTVEEFKSDVEKIKEKQLVAGEPLTESKIIYLHWGDSCYEVDENETITTYTNLSSGWMGTEPETIIEYLKENYITDKNDNIKLLYIITDGLVDSSSAKRCFSLNEDMHYETVVFHAFHEDLDQVDLSVAASFFKSCCMVYRNYELYENTDISKEFEYDKINVDNFDAELDPLKSYIRLKFIKTYKQDAVALQEISKLKKLRDRLFKEFSSKTDNSKVNTKLETKDKNVFLREFVQTVWYKNLVGEVNMGKIHIEKCITTLINYIVSESKSYSFNALKFDTKFEQAAEVEDIVDVNFTAEQEIEFPDVILEDEKGIPVVILNTLNLMNKIIFHEKKGESSEVSSASFSKFQKAMECPLFLVKDKEISESIGYFYTLNVYKQLLENSIRTDPRTRKPFHGGLVVTDTDQFDKYNDYILSATYFDSKKVRYNVGLFYYVLWKNCENKEWMDKNVVEQFKKYTMRRISEATCKIAMSSLPLDPQDKTSLLTALWYCVELSSYIFKDDPKNFNQERLRMYHGVSRYMIEILKYFNYDLDLKKINERRDLISNVMTLKKIPKYREKVYYCLEKIFKTEEGFLVSKIEKPRNLYKLNYLKFNHKEMLCENVLKEKVHLNNYIHLMHYQGDLDISIAGKSTIEICKNTLRPFFVIDQNTSFYVELVKNSKKVVIKNDYHKENIHIVYEAVFSLEFDRILSVYNLYVNCVEILKKYPTLPEYMEYISNKKKFNKDLVTIFATNVYYDIKNVYECYQKIATNVEVSQFIKLRRDYANRIKRIKAEGRLEFKSDDDIHQFIADQEFLAGLKKKIPPKKKTIQKTKTLQKNKTLQKRKRYVSKHHTLIR